MKRLLQDAAILVMMMTFSLAGCAPSRALSDENATPIPNPGSGWQEAFDLSECTMATTGRNQYFILEPGFQIVLEGGKEKVAITVLDETITLDGVETRVVEEREWKNNELKEVSRNFFAICEETNDVFYFGEDVDMYTGRKVTSHGGAWRSGDEDARFGLIMPGNPTEGMKYYQEFAPGVALDRAKVISTSETFNTPAGEFKNCLVTEESSPLEPLVTERKTYAPGIGLVQDQSLRLVSYGPVEETAPQESP